MRAPTEAWWRRRSYVGAVPTETGQQAASHLALDRLTQEFPDKDKLLAVVEQHMRSARRNRETDRAELYQEVDRGELMETAIRRLSASSIRGGFLRANDLEFLGATETKQVHEQIAQELAGIGAVLKMNAGTVVVQTPLPGSPAFAGGLRAEIASSPSTNPVADGKQLETAMQLLRDPSARP